MSLLHPLLTIIGLAALAAAAAYALLGLIAVTVWRLRRPAAAALPLPAVTVLKPVCGAEPGLYEHLRSFCEQDSPAFQIVFGVRDRTDPALAVVRRLASQYPSVPIDVVVNPQQHGSNAKVSNLINMLGAARHDVLVVADSDTFVGSDYLATVTAPLQDPGVGLVTCIYRDVPTAGIWSRLGAMYINEWYMPSVLLAWLFGFRGYASGQTLCLRRSTLQAIGGLAAIANHLADDYKMGELIRRSGHRIVMSPAPVWAQHHEPDLDSLTRHELRWMRTIQVLRAHSFRLLFVTFSLPLAALGLLLAATDPAWGKPALLLFLITLLARLALHFAHRRSPARMLFSDLWLLPLRDLLLCWAWYRSFFTSR
ncbi:MAG TPA: bacteriohopanetetrol glucosamine biosynthesis glycosyltransferase HpnI, partial [Steroidobacteraceae bacterium]